MKSILSIAVAAAIFPASSFADIPPVDSVGRPARIVCGSTAGGQQIFAAHADKIIFTLSGALVAQQQADQAALNNVPRDTELDIKVIDDPQTIADLKGRKVAHGKLEMWQNIFAIKSCGR